MWLPSHGFKNQTESRNFFIFFQNSWFNSVFDRFWAFFSGPNWPLVPSSTGWAGRADPVRFLKHNSFPKGQSHFPSKAWLNNPIIQIPKTPASTGHTTFSQATSEYLNTLVDLPYRKFLWILSNLSATCCGILNKDK